MKQETFCVQVREFFSKRILPTFEKMIADKSSKICTLSLVLTTLSIIPHWGNIAYACIALDAYSLNDAMKQHQIIKWQSAVSVLSISLSVCSLILPPKLALMIGITSVMLDILMLAYTILKMDWQTVDTMCKSSGVDSLPKKEN